jgi:hypothetical protein
MQMGIGPAHYNLQRTVQLAKRDISFDQEATLYRRSCTEQSDFDRVDWHDESHSGRECSLSHVAVITVPICSDRKHLARRKNVIYAIACSRQEPVSCKLALP